MRNSELKSGAILTAVPENELKYDEYSVTVDGIPAELYAVRVSAIPFNRPWPGHQRSLDQTELAALLSFDMTAPVDISLETKEAITHAVVRPQSKNTEVKIEGNRIYFTIETPGQYTVEINGRHHVLHLFANEPDIVPSREEYTYYFEPGVHDMGNICLSSGESMYIAAGAVVYGAVQAYDAENIKISGRGILDYSKIERHTPFIYEKEGMINLVRCCNVTLDGIILRDSSWWTISSANCSNLYFHNVKTCGMWRYNSDGFDFICCQNVHIDGCFLRNFDDVIVFKGYDLGEFDIHPISPEGVVSPAYNLQNVENCLVENCVLWCDWGGALEIGAETATDEYVNMVFRNCDIIHNHGGAMRIHSGDRATVHNVLYDNIRVEYSRFDMNCGVIQENDDSQFILPDERHPANVIQNWMYTNVFSKSGLLGNVYDITYRSIYVLLDEGVEFPGIKIIGEDDMHGFWNVTIDGFFVNGKRTEPIIEKNEYTDISVL